MTTSQALYSSRSCSVESFIMVLLTFFFPLCFTMLLIVSTRRDGKKRKSKKGFSKPVIEIHSGYILNSKSADLRHPDVAVR